LIGGNVGVVVRAVAAGVAAAIAALEVVGGGEDEQAAFEVVVFGGQGLVGHDTIVADLASLPPKPSLDGAPALILAA
jgi:hypothetical protein